ncbi:hypothetical protein X943_003793 [Babesia divergens]|uniref:SART-1 family protein n=1 Tax=Babesia divergens TaxID=32595 RepID=A0AAD9G7Z3_BABDI|nr:hypothetical protein X943_003793 [Babesia divergens]
MDRSVDHGTESLSIEETNAIRLKLGLKPLAVEQSNDKSATNECRPADNASKDADANFEFQDARRSLIEGGSIADMLKRHSGAADGAADDKASAQIDVKAWARRMATIAARNRITALSYSDDEEESSTQAPSASKASTRREQAKLKVLHKVDDLGLDSGKGVVLTLADVGVLEVEAAGVADVAFLENPEMPSKSNHKAGMKGKGAVDYNPYEEDDDDMVDGKPDILRKYDEAIDEYKGTKLKNLATGKRGFYLSLDEETEQRTKKPVTMLTQPTEESFSFEGLQRKKDLLKNRQKAINWDKVFKVSSKEVSADSERFDDSKCSQIVKVSNLDTDDVEECNHLYKQLSKHRNRIMSTVKPDSLLATTPVVPKTSIIDTGTVKEQDSGLQINATSEFIHVVKPKDIIEEPEAFASRKVSLEPSNEHAEGDTTEEPVDYAEGDVDNNAPMTMGISEALAYLKDKGDLIEEKKDLSDVGKDINLQYIDEYGRRMTPKEAFRKISWRFHGKGPGMNKQERKIKRIERERLAKQNPLEGLPTIKALLTHQKEAKTSHLVLSGNSTSL